MFERNNKYKYKNGFTQVPNKELIRTEIPFRARFLYCILLFHSFGKEECFPSEQLLANEMGVSARYIREILDLLIKFELINVKVRGYKGRSNRYCLPLIKPKYGNLHSSVNKSDSSRRGPSVPTSIGNIVPTNNIQLITKNNNYQNFEGYKKCVDFRNKFAKLKRPP